VAAASDPDPVVVEIAVAQKRDLKDTVTLTGTTTPYQQVTLYARTTGYLRRLTVDIGDRVQQGELIAKLEVPEMETQIREKKAALQEAETGIEEARARLEQSQAEAEFAGINFRRLKSIHDRDADVLPQQDVDQARASQGVALGKQKSAETGVRTAEASVAAAKAGLETIETLMRYSVIRAPISGVVTQRFVDPGALIQVASASRTQTAPVVTIAQLDRLRIFVDAPEPSSPFVHAGTPATVELPDLPNEKIESPVTRVSDALDPSSRTMRVEVDIENHKGHLRPGMTVRVSLMLRNLRGAVTVPVNAVRTQGITHTVYILDGHTARAVGVTTGLESPEWIQIVTGLQGGEKVITSAAGELKEGVHVRVRS
jgi:RND family efflux transporter MFP subunit